MKILILFVNFTLDLLNDFQVDDDIYPYEEIKK